MGQPCRASVCFFAHKLSDFSTQLTWYRTDEMIELSPEQAFRMKEETVRNKEEEYFVADVKIWHQLHCIVCLFILFLAHPQD